MDTETPGDDGTLGPCCGCETTAGVNSIVTLHKRCQVPGHGWGCVVCGLHPDGASAVLCDDCIVRYLGGDDVIRFACRGWPGTDGRAPIGEFTEPFDHDRTVDHAA